MPWPPPSTRRSATWARRCVRAPRSPENTSAADLRALVEEINNGAVDILVITAWNPVYSTPVDLGLRPR